MPIACAGRSAKVGVLPDKIRTRQTGMFAKQGFRAPKWDNVHRQETHNLTVTSSDGKTSTADVPLISAVLREDYREDLPAKSKSSSIGKAAQEQDRKYDEALVRTVMEGRYHLEGGPDKSLSAMSSSQKASYRREMNYGKDIIKQNRFSVTANSSMSPASTKKLIGRSSASSPQLSAMQDLTWSGSPSTLSPKAAETRGLGNPMSVTRGSMTPKLPRRPSSALVMSDTNRSASSQSSFLSPAATQSLNRLMTSTTLPNQRLAVQTALKAAAVAASPMRETKRLRPTSGLERKNSAGMFRSASPKTTGQQTPNSHERAPGSKSVHQFPKELLAKIVEQYRKRRPKRNHRTGYKMKPAMFMNMSNDQALDMLRMKVQQKLSSGPGEIRRSFELFDKDGSGTVDLAELSEVLGMMNINIPPEQVLSMMAQFDDDCSGELDYQEFVRRVLAPDFDSETMTQAKGGMIFGSDQSKRQLKGHGRDSFDNPAMSLTNKQVLKLLRHKVNQRVKGGPGVLRRSFAHFDKDGSGAIDSSEMKEVLQKFNIEISDEQIEDIVNQFDSHGIGEIDYNDFVNQVMEPEQKMSLKLEGSKGTSGRQLPGYMRRGPQTKQDWKAVSDFRQLVQLKMPGGNVALRQSFELMDVGATGRVQWSRFRSIMRKFIPSMQDKQSRRVFEMFDENGDGAIVFSEFCSIMDMTDAQLMHLQAQKDISASEIAALRQSSLTEGGSISRSVGSSSRPASAASVVNLRL